MVGGGVSTFRHLLFCTNRILSVLCVPTVSCLYYVYLLYLVCAMCTNCILSVTTALLCQLYLVCTMCTKCANRILSVPSVFLYQLHQCTKCAMEGVSTFRHHSGRTGFSICTNCTVDNKSIFCFGRGQDEMF